MPGALPMIEFSNQLFVQNTLLLFLDTCSINCSKIERDRRTKEREARQYARSGESRYDDSDDEKSVRRSATTSSASRPSVSSQRLVSKYRDSPASRRYQTTEATSHSASTLSVSEPVAESSNAQEAPSTDTN